VLLHLHQLSDASLSLHQHQKNRKRTALKVLRSVLAMSYSEKEMWRAGFWDSTKSCRKKADLCPMLSWEQQLTCSEKTNKMHLSRHCHKNAGCAYLRYAFIAVPITIWNAVEFGLHKTTNTSKIRHHSYCYTANTVIYMDNHWIIALRLQLVLLLPPLFYGQ